MLFGKLFLRWTIVELNTTNPHFRCVSDNSLDIQPSERNEKCTTAIHFHHFIYIKRTVIAHIYHNHNNTNGTKHGLNYYKCFLVLFCCFSLLPLPLPLLLARCCSHFYLCNIYLVFCWQSLMVWCGIHSSVNGVSAIAQSCRSLLVWKAVWIGLLWPKLNISTHMVKYGIQ